MKKKFGVVSIIFLLIIIAIFFDKITEFIVNIQWYKEVGYLSVYFTKIFATLKLMIPTFVVIYLIIWLYYKSLKKSIVKYKQTINIDINRGKVSKKILVIANIVISFMVSYSFSSNYWYRILQFTNSTNFNIKDPIFNKDVSFYVFKLPLIESIYQIIMTVLVFLVVITLLAYLIINATNGIRRSDIKQSVKEVINIKDGLTKFAGRQLAVVSSLILLFLSLGYLIKSWDLVYSPRGVAFGASYTDIHISLVFYRIIIIVSLIASIVIFLSVLSSKVKPIIISIVVIVLLIVSENLVSNLVQNFIVKSNEKTLEQPYIKYNIDYTRKAFNIDKVQMKDFPVKNTLTKEDLLKNNETIGNIKVNSFKQSLEFYNQVQVIRYYYTFNDIDVDRYNINGKYNQVFIAPREIDLDSLEGNASTWQNRHLIYTHGYGVVMSKVNSVTSEGQPDFVINDIPPANLTNIPLNNPRIYFGESTNEYAIVNTKMNEFDYPKGGDNQTNKYDGNAGIRMTPLNRLLFAINQKNMNFILSRDIKSDSRILINRNINDRLNKIAPFLKFDSDPYIVIDGGKLYWIVDAYTTSDRYPFSQPFNNVNYIRNSVKVVINAFDGSTNFYIYDSKDPIINSYAKIFPGLFKSYDQIPKTLLPHLKYPADIFNIQCNVMGKYHVTDPGVFYNGEDLWQIAKNQKEIDGEATSTDTSYMIMKLPGEQKEEMVLLDYFNIRNKDNMVALLGARMDGNNYGKMVIYKFPSDKTIYSPYLFKQNINQDTSISKELSLWNKAGSQVQYGDTIIVPINNSLLYIEPMYLRAQGKNSIPEMKRVIVSYADKMVLAENIDKALDEIFDMNYENANNNTNAVDNNKVKNNEKDKVKEAADLYNSAVEAQKSGDWSKYGEYINKLGKVLQDLNK